MSRIQITKELRNTFNIINSQCQQDLPPTVIHIMIRYLFDLYPLWRNFILKQKLIRKFKPLIWRNRKIGIEVKLKVIEHFEEIFLKVLNTLRKNENEAISFNLYPGKDRTQRTFETALQALAFLIKVGIWSNLNCSKYDDGVYNLWEYLSNTGSILPHMGLDAFNNLNVYELYKEILLLLPDNQMYAVYRLGQQEQNILEKFLNSCFKKYSRFYPNIYLNELKKMDLLFQKQGIYVRREGYIVRNLNYLKVAFLIDSPNNRNLITILNKIPQFIKYTNQIKSRQLALFDTLNNLNLLPSVLNSIIAAYSNGNLAGLASSLHSQLVELRSIYKSRLKNFFKYANFLLEPLSAVAGDRVLEFTHGPHNRPFESSPGYNLFLFFQELNLAPKDYEYKAIKLIENLINSQEIYYLDISDEFDEREEKYSSVLEGLKNSYPDEADPKLDQFMSDLLDLAGGHTSLIVSKSLLGNECKTFSRLQSYSPMPKRLCAEQELNEFLNKRVVDEKDSINFLMVEEADENRVKLFIKLKALKTLELLKMNYISTSIHLSPYYIDRVFAKIDPKYIEAVEPFQDYGYEIKLNRLAYDVLCNSANNQKINSVIDTIRELMTPLNEALKNFPYKKHKPVDDFINTFNDDFNILSKTVDEEAILPNCVDCLKGWREQLNIIMNSPDLNTSFTGLHRFLPNPAKKLIQVIKKTEKEIENLEKSINSLLKKSSTGEIALMLHSLG